MKDTITIGLARMGMYLPEKVESSREIAQKLGLPLEIVEKKMGLKQKYIAAPDEHVSDMAVKAAQDALQDFDPEKLDAVIFFGSQHKDYPLWPCACKIQYELKAKNAFATEIMSLCVSFTVALRMVKGMMLSEKKMNNVLLVMASRESHLIDYNNPRVSFMYNFSDGGAAVLLTKGLNKNIILETHNITAGFFSKHVKIMEGGSVNPLRSKNPSDPMPMLDVVDHAEMKEYLGPVTFANFASVVEIALKKSGKTKADLDFLAPIHFKRSLHRKMLEFLKLQENQSYYLEEYGHVQAGDQIIVLLEASRRGLLKDGDIVSLLAAGTGYTWGATILRWGEI